MKHLLRAAGAFIRDHSGIGLLFALLLSAGVTAAGAQGLTPVLVAPSKPPSAGSQCSVWLYCLNDSPHEVSQTFASSLRATLTSTTGQVSTVLSLNTHHTAPTVTIRPGGFVKAEYWLAVPAAMSGQVTLAADNFNPVVFSVAAAALAPASEAAETAAPPPAVTPAQRSGYMVYLGDHLSTYEPIYFILGTYPAAEFQFSIKYKVFSITNTWNPLAHFYLGYTQTSFWDLISKDPSFYDTSYKPSAFLYYHNVLHDGFFHLDLQPGIEHESNGRGGSGERSLYTAYVQPTVTIDLPEHLEFTLQPRAWGYLDVGDNNPDIAAYRGYADLRTALTWNDPNSAEKIQFAAKLETGDEGTHDGFQFDLRFNLAGVKFLSTFNPSIQVQYFTGYGQTLRQYDQSSHGLRAGICLWY